MTQDEFCTVLSVMAKEIDILRYQIKELEEANRNLSQQVCHMKLEHIMKEDFDHGI